MTKYDRIFDTMFEDGASAEDIAAAFNAAVKRDAARKEAEEKAKREEKLKTEKLNKAHENMTKAVCDYFLLLDPSFSLDKKEMNKCMKPFFEQVEEILNPETRKRISKDEEIIRNFLNSIIM